MQDVVAEKAAHLHPGKEPSERPPKPIERADRLVRYGNAAKLIASWIVGACVGLGSAYGWARGKADRTYVDSAESRVAAIIHDNSAKLQTTNERIAKLEGATALVLEQNREILSMVRKINDLDERRRTPTRLPVQEAR